MVELAFFVNDDEGDVVPSGISTKVLWDFVVGAICCTLVGPDVMMVEGLTRHGGNVQRGNPFDGGERDMLMLDGISDEQARCIGACGDIALLGFQVGEGVVLT